MDDRWAKGYKKNGRKNILLRKGIEKHLFNP
jgi:hypothetical protein